MVEHAVNIAGGLHHAMPGNASGFCIFNDAALGIRTLLAQGTSKVAYVDVDVHHGDGVQAVFYDDPRVLTISLHQDPAPCSPAPDSPTKSATGGAEGTSVNLALPPATGDTGWLRAFSAVVPGVLRAFGPDVLVTQCGCDAHHEDPLANLALTVDGQRAAIAALHGLAHEVCGGRWLASAAADTAWSAACRAPGPTCSPRPAGSGAATDAGAGGVGGTAARAGDAGVAADDDGRVGGR